LNDKVAFFLSALLDLKSSQLYIIYRERDIRKELKEMDKKFEALILVNGKMLTEFKGKAKNVNAVRWLVFENFDNAEIIDLHWL
jgi:hypothetical protein